VVTIATPRQLATVVRLQRSAGVAARHHDIRETPRPLTAATLASSGTTEPAPTKKREHRPGASRPHKARRPQRGTHPGRPTRTDRPTRDRSLDGSPGRKPVRTTGERSADRNPGQPRAKSGKKARWTKSDRDRRR
jgi:hypothetical protein